MLYCPALGSEHTPFPTLSDPHPGQCKQNQEETKTDYLPRMYSSNAPSQQNKVTKNKNKQGSACNFRISVRLLQT